MKRRHQAWLLLALGLLIGGVTLALTWREQRRAALPPTALVAEAGVYPVASLFAVQNAAAQPDAGHPAPDFVIHLPDGSSTSLTAYRGQPVVINFWATWCPPCREEMPELARAYERYREQGLVVLAINDAEAHDQVAAFLQESNLNLPMIIDPQGEVMRAYKTNALPSTFFIDRRGIVQVRWIGVLTPDILEQHLRTIL